MVGMIHIYSDSNWTVYIVERQSNYVCNHAKSLRVLPRLLVRVQGFVPEYFQRVLRSAIPLLR